MQDFNTFLLLTFFYASKFTITFFPLVALTSTPTAMSIKPKETDIITVLSPWSDACYIHKEYDVIKLHYVKQIYFKIPKIAFLDTWCLRYLYILLSKTVWLFSSKYMFINWFKNFYPISFGRMVSCLYLFPHTLIVSFRFNKRAAKYSISVFLYFVRFWKFMSSIVVSFILHMCLIHSYNLDSIQLFCNEASYTMFL